MTWHAIHELPYAQVKLDHSYDTHVRELPLPHQALFSSPLRQAISVTDIKSDLRIFCPNPIRTPKKFLEPICDACVLAEHKLLMALYEEDGLRSEGLIWGSEVTIEIEPEDGSKYDSLHEPPNHQSASPQSISHTHETHSEALYTDEDADDEESMHIASPLPFEKTETLTDVRGRPRSRTKQLRRRGVDLSRDELRISPCWSDSEKQSMEVFRDAIKEKARHNVHDEGLLGRLRTNKGRLIVEEAKSITNKVTKRLRNSMSKNRHPHTKEAHWSGTEVSRPLLETRPSYQPMPVIKAVRSLEDETRPTLRHTDSCNPVHADRHVFSSKSYTSLADDLDTLDPSPLICTVQRKDSTTSWQRHLEHDLQPSVARRLHHKRGRYRLQECADTTNDTGLQRNDRALSPSYSLADNRTRLRYGTDAQSLLQPSSARSIMSDCDVEPYWRLPSLADSGTSHPSNLHSVSSSFLPQPQRMNEIVSSRDFDSAWWRDDRIARSISASASPEVTDIASDSFSSDNEPDPLRSSKFQPTSTELVTALRAQLARRGNQDRRTSPRPDLQNSSAAQDKTASLQNIPVANTPDTKRVTQHTNSQTHDKRASHRPPSQRIISSLSLPDTRISSAMSRFSSLHNGDHRLDLSEDEEGGQIHEQENRKLAMAMAEDMRRLALHPLGVRLPAENLVRPSIGHGRPLYE